VSKRGCEFGLSSACRKEWSGGGECDEGGGEEVEVEVVGGY